MTCTQASAEHPGVLSHPRAPPGHSLRTRSPSHHTLRLTHTTNCISGGAGVHRASPPPPRPAVTPSWWDPSYQGPATSGSSPRVGQHRWGVAGPAGRAKHLPMPKAKPAPTPVPLSKHPSRNPPSGPILLRLLQVGARAPTSITGKGSRALPGTQESSDGKAGGKTACLKTQRRC